MAEARQRSLAEFAEPIESAAHPDEQLMAQTVERVRATDPNAADALQYCAIVRRFDAKCIGVLRNQPDQTAENERILAAVTAHSFVLPRSEGGYFYHDNVRDLMLAWSRRPENQARLNEYNLRLVSAWEREQKEAQRVELSLTRVETLLLKANPARYRQVATQLEQRLLLALLEALYHQTIISAESGYDLFNTYFFRWGSAPAGAGSVRRWWRRNRNTFRRCIRTTTTLRITAG